MNFDASFSNNGIGAAGIIIKDEYGSFVVSFAEKFHLQTPLEAKSHAALIGLWLIKSMDFRKWFVEGDALTVIKYLQQPPHLCP